MARAAGLTLALGLAACGDPPAPAPPPPPRERAVLLVTLDGVRPRDALVGVERDRALAAALDERDVVPASQLMPELTRLVASHGAVIGAPGEGAPVTAAGPKYVSQPGYLEMALGTAMHGCPDNKCPKTGGETWLDVCASMHDTGRPEALLVGSWERLALVASGQNPAVVVSAGRREGQRREVLASDPIMARLLAEGEASPAYPGDEGYRPDASTAPLALRALEVLRPRCAWVALGDTDEWAHRGSYPAYLASLREADRTLGALARIVLADAARDTLVIVATDHGRAETFMHHGGHASSAAVWIAAFTAQGRGRGVVAPREARGLVDIAPTLRAWLGARAGGGEGRVLEELLP